jgi:hypothetical protein
MRLKIEKGAPFATVLHVGRSEGGGVWSAGTFDVGAPGRMYRTARDTELLYVFYVEIAPQSTYSYTPPHIWGISYEMSSKANAFCVYNMSFSARKAQSTQDVYTIGALKLLETWPKLDAACFAAGEPRPVPWAARGEADIYETQVEHVLNLINDYVKPLDRGFGLLP